MVPFVREEKLEPGPQAQRAEPGMPAGSGELLGRQERDPSREIGSRRAELFHHLFKGSGLPCRPFRVLFGPVGRKGRIFLGQDPSHALDRELRVAREMRGVLRNRPLAVDTFVELGSGHAIDELGKGVELLQEPLGDRSGIVHNSFSRERAYL